MVCSLRSVRKGGNAHAWIQNSILPFLVPEAVPQQPRWPWGLSGQGPHARLLYTMSMWVLMIWDTINISELPQSPQIASETKMYPANKVDWTPWGGCPNYQIEKLNLTLPQIYFHLNPTWILTLHHKYIYVSACISYKYSIVFFSWYIYLWLMEQPIGSSQFY